MEKTLEIWHELVRSRQMVLLDEILADEIRFHSPFVWKPKEGKAMAKFILSNVIEVFEDFRYVRQIVGETDCCLEFEARVGELSLRGVDLIRIDESGKIIDFEVMVRPANALQTLGAEMGKRIGA
jgi:hypothetical protein